MNEYKLKFGNRVLTYPGHNGYVMFNGTQPKSLTLYASEGGTLTANEITGLPGDTIILSTAYNTYWRFSGYELTGDGELVGDTYTFGSEDATICACYKKNAFTAYGDFNMITAGTYIIENGATSNAISYAHYVSGDNVPSSYYNLTLSSNNGGTKNVKESGWNPSEEISGYWLSADTIAESWSERLATRITASLQTNEIDFGNVITTSIGGGQTYVENLHSETFTPGITRRYLNVYNATTRHYFQNLRNITQNSWTATGYAP